MLELEDVTFRRGDRDIISRISLSVGAGEHWPLLGANGAGKSTLMGLCGATAHPSYGTVGFWANAWDEWNCRPCAALSVT